MSIEQMKNLGIIDDLGNLDMDQVETFLAKVNLSSENIEQYREEKKTAKQQLSEFTKVILERKNELQQIEAEMEQINKRIAKIDRYQKLNNGAISEKSEKERTQLQTRLKDLTTKKNDTVARHNLAVSNHKKSKQQIEDLDVKITDNEKKINENKESLRVVYEFCYDGLKNIDVNDIQQEIAIQYQNGKVDTDVEILNLKHKMDVLPKHYNDVMSLIKDSDEYENTDLKDIIEEFEKQNAPQQKQNTQQGYMPGQSYWERQYPRINEVDPYKKELTGKKMSLSELAEKEKIFSDKPLNQREFSGRQIPDKTIDDLKLENSNGPKKIIKFKQATDKMLKTINNAWHKFKLTDEAYQTWLNNQNSKTK